jgi:hypothetical protein
MAPARLMTPTPATTEDLIVRIVGLGSRRGLSTEKSMDNRTAKEVPRSNVSAAQHVVMPTPPTHMDKYIYIKAIKYSRWLRLRSKNPHEHCLHSVFRTGGRNCARTGTQKMQVYALTGWDIVLLMPIIFSSHKLMHILIYREIPQHSILKRKKKDINIT